MKALWLLLPWLVISAADDPAAVARAVLTKGANDKEADTRRDVAAAMSLINTRDPVSSLFKDLVRDRDHTVRETAVLSIGELSDLKLAYLLVPSLQDDVPEVAFAAARSLAALRKPEGKEALISILSGETKADSGFVREKMRDIARRMRTPKSAVLFAAQYGVAFVPVPGVGQGYSAMNAMFGDRDFSARATALLLLAKDRTPEVRKLLLASFKDDDWSVRAAAAQSAALRNDLSLRAQLVPLLEDPDRRVRFRAAAVYLRLNRRS